jgi:transcriptional regulator with XRE-family HTH domain
MLIWTTNVVTTWRQKLGSEIEKARRQAKLTQAELSTATGLTRNSIGHYERGERAPDLETLRKIAATVAADHFEVDEGVRVVFTSNGSRPQLTTAAQQLTLSFDEAGGVTVRIQPQSTGLAIRIVSRTAM